MGLLTGISLGTIIRLIGSGIILTFIGYGYYLHQNNKALEKDIALYEVRINEVLNAVDVAVEERNILKRDVRIRDELVRKREVSIKIKNTRLSKQLHELNKIRRIKLPENSCLETELPDFILDVLPIDNKLTKELTQ